MRQVGARREPELVAAAAGELMAEVARFSETMARLAPTTFVPKGIYRFKSHQDANRHAVDCLTASIGLQYASGEPILKSI